MRRSYGSTTYTLAYARIAAEFGPGAAALFLAGSFDPQDPANAKYRIGASGPHAPVAVAVPTQVVVKEEVEDDVAEKGLEEDVVQDTDVEDNVGSDSEREI